MKSLKWSMFYLYLFITVINILSLIQMNRVFGSEDMISREKKIQENPKRYKILKLNTPEDVLEDSDEIKYLYSVKDINLDDYDVDEKKNLFFKIMMPMIKVSTGEVSAEKEIVKNIIHKGKVGPKEKKILDKLFEEYKIEDRDIEKLADRMIIPPASIILGQAILESGWGTSRFFVEGNNVFGIWSYDPDEPRMHAEESRDGGFTASLKKYRSIKESIDDYIILLSTGGAYESFRDGVNRGEKSSDLTKYLTKYSELGEDYIVRLDNVITANELYNYD